MSATEQRKVQPLRAWRAIRRLLANPEETEHVFEIIEALAGNTLERNFNRLQSTPSGRHLFERRDSILEVLRNREALRALPEGSLGRHYTAYMDREGLSADGLVEASDIEERTEAREELAWMGLRLRDSHDLWHVVSGYGRDELGELSLLAFTYAQTRNPGIGAIILFGALKMSREIGFSRVGRAVREGWRRGRAASWLPGQDWQALLTLPLESVRSALNVEPIRAYEPLLRERMAEAAIAA